MKKKLISVLSLVLVVCFIWVAEVDAADVTYSTVDDFYYLFSSVYLDNSYNNVNIVVMDAEYQEEIYSFPSIWGSSPDSAVRLFNLNTSTNIGDFVSLVFYVVSSSNPSYIGSYSIRYFGTSTVPSDLIVNSSVVSLDLIVDNIKASYSAIKFEISYTVSVSSSLEVNLFLNSRCYYGVGFLSPHLVYGLSNEEKQILQQILLGVNSANDQLDDMQSEQSSYYEDILQSEASDTDVIAEASSKREQFDDIMNEYSSLNADLARPGVDELLPDYSSVVNGFKDDKFYESFDVFYDNAYIMFMLLATFFFATLSYIIFGKKA